jgi:hypothetical protein
MPVDRLISLVLAAVYLALAAMSGDARSVFAVILWILLALALIWFGDELGEYMGTMKGSLVTAKSPGSLVRFFGWLFLLAPLLYILYLLVTGASLTGARSFE